MTRIIDKVFRDFAAEQGWREGSTQFLLGAEYIEDVVTGYIGTLLWSESCNGTAPLTVCDHSGKRDEEAGECDRSLEYLNYGECDLSGEAYASIRKDVSSFVVSNWDDLYSDQALHPATIGHEFLLIRNGHGAGFWDAGLGERGKRLTANAKPYGETNAYVGDDELIHVS